jgi:L-asparaginase/Glu-tRNA(Gln) amidotransferase subunit D
MDEILELHLPESRVLIIITGGTICMKPSKDGLVPVSMSSLRRQKLYNFRVPISDCV